MSNRVLIYGAGAIGRGFLAPLLYRYGYRISFVDRDEELISELQAKQHYQAAITATSAYEFITVPVENAYLPGEVPRIEDFYLVICCVGPKNCYDLVKEFKDARVVISCENDQSTVKGLQELSGNRNIYFGTDNTECCTVGIESNVSSL